MSFRAFKNPPSSQNDAPLSEGTPSQEEIRALCREIQKGWSEKERRRRSGHLDRFVRILEVRTPQGV